ncbi:hypothetical protein JJV70_16955 [Streptomyces sp. JJ66]|uniref:DUF7848 domain-containing protein n=1 Tax=Streptomyces sp. JJ66 TaxID=2803843 RepID=UPI001C5A02FC|nr:hypothetical protein [Streptomyces sp. JJ66]MBW1603767.1 hypothetical protein [Streptomyces sp. JJ66]
MRRAVFRYLVWVSEPDREPDAAPLTHRMACDVCGATSPTGVDFGAVQDWQLRHAGANPSHHTYTETLTRPWRAWPRGPA